MVRLNKIYTRTGDSGETGLVGGERLSKADPRMAAIGNVDEVNCAIGVAIGRLGESGHAVALARIQNELFDLGADFATPAKDGDFAPSEMVLRITAGQVERIEREIDAMNAGLAPLRSFILPAGPGGTAELHLARAVVRRAERSAVAAVRAGVALNPQALAYINRLSDHLFVLARLVAAGAGGEVLWKPGSTR